MAVCLSVPILSGEEKMCVEVDAVDAAWCTHGCMKAGTVQSAQVICLCIVHAHRGKGQNSSASFA